MREKLTSSIFWLKSRFPMVYSLMVLLVLAVPWYAVGSWLFVLSGQDQRPTVTSFVLYGFWPISLSFIFAFVIDECRARERNGKKGILILGPVSTGVMIWYIFPMLINGASEFLSIVSDISPKDCLSVREWGWKLQGWIGTILFWGWMFRGAPNLFAKNDSNGQESTG